jgi:hypothetical protein
MAKYEKFILQKENDWFRECSSCMHMTLGSPTAPEMVCEKCSASFCFHHADAHTGISCQDFRRKKKENPAKVAMTGLWKSMHTKRCPHCKVAIQKNGGCPNMQCLSCKQSFCWHCLSKKRQHRRGLLKKVVHNKKKAAAAVITAPATIPIAAAAGTIAVALAIPGVPLMMLWNQAKEQKRKRQLTVSPRARSHSFQSRVPRQHPPSIHECAHFFSTSGTGRCIFCGALDNDVLDGDGSLASLE